MSVEDYRTYVEHPRYGREPRLTRLPLPKGARRSIFRGREDRIPETAVEVDTSLQPLAVAVAKPPSRVTPRELLPSR